MGKCHPKLVPQTMTLNCKMKRPTLNKDIDCVCSKKCKLKGLRAHRRFCYVNTTLNLDSLFTSEYYSNSNSPRTQSQHLNNDVQNNSCPTNISAGLFNDKKLVKNGIKLPKSSAEWEEANLYFTGALDYNSETLKLANYRMRFMTIFNKPQARLAMLKIISR